MSHTKNAFVLLHFGDNIKYFELELYLIIMLRHNTKMDCVYMYSINDTPQSYIDTMKTLFDSIIGIDDKGLTYETKFKSHYTHFNTLRTCNFMFAYTLCKYETICIIESDMVIMSDMDSVFKLHTPAVLFVKNNKTDINSNKLMPIMHNENCDKYSDINGGIMVFSPSNAIFKLMKKELKTIIDHNCKYPNEELFLRCNKVIYNLPIKYNYCHYNLSSKLCTSPPIIVHFNETKFKHLDIVKENYVNKFPEKIKITEFFRKNYYNKYKKIINDIVDNIII